MDLREVVARIKAEGDPLRPPKAEHKSRSEAEKKKRRAAKRGTKASFSEEAYKAKIARDRRVYTSPKGAWMHLRKTYKSRARARGEESKWLISLQEWLLLWQEAGMERLSNTASVSLFKLRSKDLAGAKVMRIDIQKPWQLDNMVVMYRGNVRANGRKIKQDMLNGY
jgi:hypothetical protein